MNCVEKTALAMAREPLQTPFGFKGGALSELWQTVCGVQLEDGALGVGTGVQSVLWADADTFANHTQTGGNALMLAVTEKALTCLAGMPFTDPPQTLQAIFGDVYAYARQVTESPALPQTFALNALVAVDFALWQAWAAQENIGTFGGLVEQFCPQMNCRQDKLGAIPLVSYNTTDDEIRALLDDGAFLLKIKIGSNPGGRGSLDEMCRWDIERLAKIHAMAGNRATPYTDCGHPVYYLDANGRYDTLNRLKHFLDGAKHCGALERVVLLEEPFAEADAVPVHDLPVRVAGDESIHCASDARRCIDELGYGAVALKPIAKTLSATMEIYAEAYKRGVPCFCADLTVPPLMLDWNMNVAARIEALPGLKIGVVESNGPQNYTRWQSLLDMHPAPKAPWLCPQKSVFELGDVFYEENPILRPAAAYQALLDL